MESDDKTIHLTPAHALDLFKHMGSGFVHPREHLYGDAKHGLSQKLWDNPFLVFELVAGSDDVCERCPWLNSGKLCCDVFTQFTPAIPKHIYNEELNDSLFKMMEIKPGRRITAAKFLDKIMSLMPEIVFLATHPFENASDTIDGLLNAGDKLKFQQQRNMPIS